MVLRLYPRAVTDHLSIPEKELSDNSHSASSDPEQLVELDRVT